MKAFEAPRLRVVSFQADDVITTSWGKEIYDFDENGKPIIDTSLEIMDF